jgi:hypothetical protein
VVPHPGARSVALDLLAAEALITLALLAQAQVAPDEAQPAPVAANPSDGFHVPRMIRSRSLPPDANQAPP